MTDLTAAMVLAAGKGTRMAALSEVLPKPAMPLPGGPVIASSLRLAAEAAGGRVVVNCWHLADRLEAAVEQAHDDGFEVVFSREPELMDTAGGLAFARDRGLLGSAGPVLVLNGDCVLRVDLEPLMDRHRAAGDLVTLALLPHLDPLRWSRVELDADGLVTAIRGRGAPATGEVPFLYTGAMIVAREALDAIPAGVGGIQEHLWHPARIAGRFGGAVVTGHWREVGTPAAYRQTVVDQLGDGNAIHPTAQLTPSATVVRSMVGEGVRIAAGAVVSESVLSHGAVVGAEARVIGSVVLGPVQVATGAKVTHEMRVPPL